MVALGEGSVEGGALVVVPEPGIIGGVRTPVEGGGDDVVATHRVSVVVATRLCDVDLTGRGPGTVGVVHGQHPDGGPHPVTSGQLGYDLDTAVLDRRTELGADAGRLDGVNDGAVSGVGDSNTIGPDSRGAVASLEEVDHIVRLHQLLVLKGWLDNERAILDVCVLVGIGGLLELTVAGNALAAVAVRFITRWNSPESADLDLFGPDLVVEAIRPILVKNRAVNVRANGLQAVPDEETSETQTDQDTDERDDRNPLLARVLLVQPWSLLLALLYSARVKVSLLWASNALEAGRGSHGRRRHGAIRGSERVCSDGLNGIAVWGARTGRGGSSSGRSRAILLVVHLARTSHCAGERMTCSRDRPVLKVAEEGCEDGRAA